MATKSYDHGKGALKPIIKPRLKEDPKTGKVIQPTVKKKVKRK